MTKEQKKELRELAAKATSGPWMLNKGFGNIVNKNPEDPKDSTHIAWESADINGQENIRYIAAANPQVILFLLDQIDQDNAMIQDLLYQLDNSRLASAEKALEFYALNDIHSVDFNYLDNGEIAREYFSKNRVKK